MISIGDLERGAGLAIQGGPDCGNRWTRAAGRGAGVLLCLAAAFAAGAAEIDSATHRRHALHDSLPALNRRFDRALRAGVDGANAENEGCDEAALYAHVRRAIVSPFIGHLLAERLDADPTLHVRRIRLRDSVYRDLSLLDAISLHARDLSGTLRLSDKLVGVDKLGHFFVEGFAYFETAYLDGEGIEAALHWGERTERTYFGTLTTGVYSFADLAVNFEGMRFWLRVLGAETDPLRDGWLFNRPYVRCGRPFFGGEPVWKVARRFRLERWLSGAWDEGVNCSRYSDPEIEALVRRRVEDRTREEGGRECPVAPVHCTRAADRYGTFAERLLHPRCLEVRRARRFRWGVW